MKFRLYSGINERRTMMERATVTPLDQGALRSMVQPKGFEQCSGKAAGGFPCQRRMGHADGCSQFSDLCEDRESIQKRLLSAAANLALRVEEASEEPKRLWSPGDTEWATIATLKQIVDILVQLKGA